MSGGGGGGKLQPAPAIAAKPTSRAEEGRLARTRACLICAEQPADAVLYRCGHRCACLRCAHFMRHERLACPLCRSPIDDVIRVYE